MLFNRHGPCLGLRLWKTKRRFAQLWFVPPHYEIEPHSHPKEHIELMYLFGSTTFFRVVGGELESFTPKARHVGKTFTVAKGVCHWFKVSAWPLIFVNFSKFDTGDNPVSAAIDFKPAS